jgi:hypothetical protein
LFPARRYGSVTWTFTPRLFADAFDWKQTGSGLRWRVTSPGIADGLAPLANLATRLVARRFRISAVNKNCRAAAR